MDCAASASAKATSNKACHNCRRRRLRCDRSYPHCNKCIAAGTECLGYGKLFRWIGAVASRGKLAGRTSCAPVDASSRTTLCSSSGSGTTITTTTTSRNSPSRNNTTLCASSRLSPKSLPPKASSICLAAPPPRLPAPPRHGDDDDADADADTGDIVCAAASPDYGFAATPWYLVDPFLQDIEPWQRRYLGYFSQRVCHELIPLSPSKLNPIFSLLPLSSAHPLLQHTLIAVSAAHMSNLIKPRLCPVSQLTSSARLPGADDSSRHAYQHALAAKHKALSLMRDAVQHIDFATADVVLAAAVFLINLELIDSGKHGWKAHLSAAGRILSLLPPALPGNEELRDLMFSDSLVYNVMASTFIPESSAGAESFSQLSHRPDHIRRAAAYSYNCCPAEILEIISEASQLSNLALDPDDEHRKAAIGLALIQRAQAFDVDAWARNDGNFLSLRSPATQTRIHAGSGYQLAVCLYILRSVPTLSAMACYDDVAEALTRDIMYHASSIADDDPHLKVVTWPTFVVGADTRDPAIREWVRQRLHVIMSYCPWGFLYTAVESLQKLWDMDTVALGQRCWVRTIKENQMDFLVV